MKTWIERFRPCRTKDLVLVKKRITSAMEYTGIVDNVDKTVDNLGLQNQNTILPIKNG
ncbi:conserved protein of unknown function [Paenibacillus alvei]|uniref:Uncharacterized protein n=1 Tax=Paenibacillus alvei TaxID=44250 RepID=A0A383RFT5_PAEAL|nr:conserved protein of unknown function [Paenibacillus alvei]